MEEKNYYVYIHYNKQNGEPFYIGKGKGNRKNQKLGRSQYWKSYVAKYDYTIDLLEDNLDETTALTLERYWISQFIVWGFKLVNFTEGGEVTIKYWLGKKRPDIAEIMKNKIVSKETRKKFSEIHKNKHYSVATEFKKGYIPKHKGISKYILFKNNRPAEEAICEYCNEKFIKRIDKPTKTCSHSCDNKIRKK